MNDAETAGPPSVPERKTIQSVAGAAIREGLTNEQALERVLAAFPYARTTKASIGKYRRMLRSQGEDVPTAAQARAEAAGQPASPPKPKRKTESSVAMAALREGKTTRQVIEIVKAQFPDSRIKQSSVSSYRDRMRRRGEVVPSAHQANAAAAAGLDQLVEDLEEARTARAAMATKADLAAMETRLAWRIAGAMVAAGIAAAAAVKLLS